MPWESLKLATRQCQVYITTTEPLCSFLYNKFVINKLIESKDPTQMPKKLRDSNTMLFFDFSLTVKAAPHECVIRTGPP